MSARAACLGAALAAGALLFSACGGAGQGPGALRMPPSTSHPLLGANVNRLFNDRELTPAQIALQLRGLAAAGATDARSDALWEATEPDPPVGGRHRWTWSFDDGIAGALARQGLRWLPIVDYAPGWAHSVAGQEHSAPRPPSAFAAFAGALADRYGPGGTFWREHPTLPPRPIAALEIWNEPDSGHFWVPAPDPAAYASLYLLARAAARAADPAVQVLVGGLTEPARFLPRLLQARPALRGAIDGVAIHPYAARPEGILNRVRTARATLRGLGLAEVPLYVTEFGWVTRPRGPHWVPAALRPGYIRATLTDLAHSGCGVAGIFLYTWETPERDPTDLEDWFGINPLGGFGINPPGGSPNADTAALTAGLRAAREPPAPGAASPCTPGVRPAAR